MANSPDSPPVKPRRRRRWWLRGLGIFLLLLVLAGAGALFWQRTSLPQLDGALRLAGPQAEVTISRSPEGLVFIQAESEADASFALGYAHAQDRLFQMEFLRRLAAGRLSEVVGAQTLQVDKWFRTLGLYRLAEENVRHLQPATLAALESYAAGVNAYLETHDGAWPIGFTLLQIEPEPWRPADSVAWGRIMALFLSSNYKDELLRARLLTLLPQDKVRQLFPGWPADAPTSIDSLHGLERRGTLERLQRVLPWELGPKKASNAWALSPHRSSTGGALLAGDPHLALRAPGDWYLARIDTPGFSQAGATTPGVPFMIMGHNGSVSWSFTTTYSDTQDLFIEEVDPEDPGRYRVGNAWEAFETRRETIRVSGEDEPVVLNVRSTRHGPVISDVVSEAAGLTEEDQVIAMAWTALDPEDRSADGLYGLGKAADVPQAIAALQALASPQQTMVLADRQGSIALVAPGRVPIRKAGDGLLPVPGASGEYDWIGTIPYAALPRSLDPASGYLLAANNKLVGDGYPYLIAAHWDYPDRAIRIAELLAEKEVWTPEEMRRMQLDILSIGARRLMGRLLEAPLPDEASAALDRMRAWDFRMEMDRPEPLIYSAWLKVLEGQLLRNQLGETLAELESGNAWRVFNLLQPGSLWCDDVATTAEESCDQLIATTLETALRELVDIYGDDVSDWQWGQAHEAQFSHPILGFIPLVNDWTTLSLPAPGGQDTINRASSSFSQPMPQSFVDRHGPGLRGVYDMASPDESGFIIATGNSGDIFSEFYLNLTETWRDGGLLRLPADPPAGSTTLTLSPLSP